MPNDFANASFAANLLLKKFDLFKIFFENLISRAPNVLVMNDLLFIEFLILLFSIISTPTPKIFHFYYFKIFLKLLMTVLSPKKIDSPIIKCPILNS